MSCAGLTRASIKFLIDGLPGLDARSQVHAGCVNLPAMRRPGNDTFVTVNQTITMTGRAGYSAVKDAVRKAGFRARRRKELQAI
jgi:hypothetical protein